MNKTNKGFAFWNSKKRKLYIKIIILINSALYMTLLSVSIKHTVFFAFFFVVGLFNMLFFSIYNKIHNPYIGLMADIESIDRSLHALLISKMGDFTATGKTKKSTDNITFHIALLKSRDMINNSEISRYINNTLLYNNVRSILSFIWFSTFFLFLIMQ